jgi:hypothetical protein
MYEQTFYSFRGKALSKKINIGELPKAEDPAGFDANVLNSLVYDAKLLKSDAKVHHCSHFLMWPWIDYILSALPLTQKFTISEFPERHLESLLITTLIICWVDFIFLDFGTREFSHFAYLNR